MALPLPVPRCVSPSGIFDRVGRIWRPADFRFTPIATAPVQCHQMTLRADFVEEVGE
jgi:hypothetical protein